MTRKRSSLPLSMVPSLPAGTFSELQVLTHKLDGISTGFQIDIVDGRFVPLKSWPFTTYEPLKELEKISTLPSSYVYELDCMVVEPENYLGIVTSLPVAKLIVHVGSTDQYGKIIRHARANGYQIGLAFTNDVPLSFIYPYISEIDFVQVMGIKHVGKQGQPFDERTIKTVELLRDSYSDLFIAVDGAVNATTIPLLIDAGANHFAPGSAISKAPNPDKAYKQLSRLLHW